MAKNVEGVRYTNFNEYGIINTKIKRLKTERGEVKCRQILQI